MSSSKMLFYSMLIISTMLIISSENLLMMWMGLEINMIAFMPILSENKSTTSSESSMMYFLIQSLGSIILMMSILINPVIMVSPDLITEVSVSLLLFSLMIKLGLPPFHFWFPEMMEKLSWLNCFILMTWQKIGPMIIMLNFVDKSSMIPMITMMTVIIGSILGLNQTSIRKIMAYSSISHLGWMLISMKMSNQIWLYYLVIYSMMTMMLTLIFNQNSSYFINQLIPNNLSFLNKSLIIFLFLSLGGLPPFLGFFPKWIVIQLMMNSNSYFLMTIMVMMALITLFFYIRLCSSLLLMQSINMKWASESKMNYSSILMLILLLLPMMAVV